MQKTIIIGNGPSILNEERGAEIDACDTVIRINDFQTKGFEPHVGTKLDIWATDTKVVWFGYLFPKMVQANAVWIVCSAVVATHKVLCWYMRDTNYITQYVKHFNKQVTVISARIAAQLEEDIGAFPSTGLTTIAAASQRFEKVWIHGFDHFAGGVYDDYYSKQPQRSHNGKREQRYVNQLIEEGRVEIL